MCCHFVMIEFFFIWLNFFSTKICKKNWQGDNVKNEFTQLDALFFCSIMQTFVLDIFFYFVSFCTH